ncbi:MAG: hypothetical protein KY457_01065, partial [Actinobacteria bacterium]|nr:hypothetical protein [Actinomycetota bacterium]
DGDGTTGTDGDLGVGGERITNDREEAVDGVSGPSVPVQGELEVGGVVIDRAAPILTPAPDGASADVQAAGSQVEAQPMPRTGASAVPMAVAAAIALLLGFGLVREPRRT